MSEDILRVLKAVAAKGRDARFCVCGAGNGGLAMAGHLGLMGFPVTVFNRNAEHLTGIVWHGGVALEGAVSGFGPIEWAGNDMSRALSGADIVMVVVPATAHAWLASQMAPFLRDGQIVVLNPGRTGGALEFAETIRRSGSPARPVLCEAQTFIYASRALSRFEARIFRIKDSVALASLPSFYLPAVLDALSPAFPQFRPGGTVLATSLENIGAVFHPALTIMNASWIESTGGDFEYYIQGISRPVAALLESIDAERLAVARSLGVPSLSAREWLYQSYGSPGADLYEAIQATGAYRGIRAPSTIRHRYITEDLPMSLVPIASIGAMMGVATPSIDMMIDMGSLLLDTDFRAIGRSARSLGLEGLGLEAIHRMVTLPADGPGTEREGGES